MRQHEKTPKGFFVPNPWDMGTPNLSEETKKMLARRARDIVAGRTGDVVDTAFLIPEIPRWALHKTAHKIAPKHISKTQFGKWLPGIGEKIAEGIDTLTEGYTAPRDTQERAVSAATRAIASLKPTKEVGKLIQKGAKAGVKKVGKFVEKMGAPTPANIGSTGASSAATTSLLEEMPDSPWSAALAGLGAGVAGGAGTHALHNIGKYGPKVSLQNMIGKGMGINPNKVKDFASDVPITMADVTNSAPRKLVQNWLNKIPGSSYIMEQARKKQGQAIRKTLGMGEEEVGAQRGASLISESAKRQRQAHRGRLDELEDKYSQALVDKDRLVPVQKPLNFVEDVLNQRGIETPTMREEYAKGPAGQFVEKIRKVVKDTNVMEPDSELLKFLKNEFDEITDIASNSPVGKRAPYKDLLQIKRNIQDQVNTWGLHGDMDQTDLKHLFNTINESIGQHLKDINPDAHQAWKKYNAIHHKHALRNVPTLEAIERETIKKIDTTDPLLNTVEALTSKKPNPHRLHVIYKGLNPTEKRDLFGSLVERLGHTNDGWNIVKMSKNFKAMSPQAERIFLDGLPQTNRENFKKMMNGLRHIDETALLENTSRTGYYAGIQNYASLIKDTIGQAANVAMGIKGAWPLAVSAMALTAPAGGALLFTNDKLLRWATNGMNIKNEKQLISHLNNIPKLGKITMPLVNEAKALQDALKKENEKSSSYFEKYAENKARGASYWSRYAETS